MKNNLFSVIVLLQIALLTACGSDDTVICEANTGTCVNDFSAVETCNAEGTKLEIITCTEGTMCGGQGECLALNEQEANNQDSQNDDFDEAEALPLNTVFSSHIGTADDVDYYQFKVTESGVIMIELNFTQQTSAGEGLYYMVTRLYSDRFPESECAWSVSNYVDEECNTDDYNLQYCADMLRLRASVYAEVGTYYLHVEGYGIEDDDITGYDTKRPYTITTEFTPGANLEDGQELLADNNIGPADTYQTAHEITLTNDANSDKITSYHYYYLDHDWFKLTAPDAITSGYVEFIVDYLEWEDFEMNAAPYFYMYGWLYEIEDHEAEMIDSEMYSDMIPPYSNCPYSVSYYTNFNSNDVYYFMLENINYDHTKPYNITAIYHNTSHPENDQPTVGDVEIGKATQSSPQRLLFEDNQIVIQSYNWYYNDDDWFYFFTPDDNGGTIEIDLDFEEAVQTNGWYFNDMCAQNLKGYNQWMYLFENGQSYYTDQITRSTDTNVYGQHIDPVTVSPDTLYYVALIGHGFGSKEIPYTLTITYTPNPE